MIKRSSSSFRGGASSSSSFPESTDPVPKSLHHIKGPLDPRLPDNAYVRAIRHRGPTGWDGETTIGTGKNQKTLTRMDAALHEYYARGPVVHVMLHEVCSRGGCGVWAAGCRCGCVDVSPQLVA